MKLAATLEALLVFCFEVFGSYGRFLKLFVFAKLASRSLLVIFGKRVVGIRVGLEEVVKG